MAEELKVSSESSAPAQPVLALAQPEQKKKQESDFPFAVSVGDVYEGPLDLLLDLIRKQDIDIYDIPIARITAQYLAYVETLRELDVNVAAEFIYMAAVLIHIKSKMLLPRDPDAPAAEDDPRSELVNRLLEHEKFKSAAQMLLQKQQIEDARSEEHTSELQSRLHLVCRLLLEKKKYNQYVLTTELRHHISVGGLYTRAKAAAYISTGDDAGCGSVACETDRSECVRSAPAKLPA